MNAAVLVAIIAGLIILYILFLPEAEREALLEEGDISKASSKSSGDDDEGLLLRKFPGRLDEVEGIIDKNIPNIFLFEKTEAEELERLNPFLV